jgi:hypothetical protein
VALLNKPVFFIGESLFRRMIMTPPENIAVGIENFQSF